MKRSEFEWKALLSKQVSPRVDFVPDHGYSSFYVVKQVLKNGQY